jgi:ABC-type Co2+ transport system permease subunit
VNTVKKSLKLALPIFLGLSVAIVAVALPVLSNAVPVAHLSPVARIVSPWQIQATYAQTGPETITEMSEEVANFAVTVMPYWTTYVVAALIFALAAWLIGRFIRAMKG